ncbi:MULTISPECIES: deoxyribodipyrimidine photo-lyase [Acinetobacter Taxon 24D]|uniref:cryptochrome/photolyase family protein n=1 Tax=Acinetobacter Taxon 24D TaxID=2839057 RepID=UPI00148F9501|nr:MULTISPECIES: deoxyribodipyrimidine photo-lyase [Acinetobacter Taxon 24D]NNG82294.1 deoxyribodipyrimidine photo-lyase [Acinetobacter sp. ANC 5378]NNG99769.1 deoxyribodipyrimidine photo-lyase [Acinetobacter sp. ANC 5414]
MQFIWFRQDLRIQDHAALWHATQAGPCIALVVISPEQWALHNDAAVKIDFYLRQLQALKTQLKTLNIPLMIRHIPFWKDVPQGVLQLAQQLNINSIHANIELGVNELKRDAQLQKLLDKYNKSLELYHDRTLFPVGSIRNKSHQPYQVFSAFKKNCYERLSVSLPQCYPPIEVQANLQFESLEDEPVCTFAALYPDHPSIKLQDHWPVSEEYALTLLDDFINDKVIHYEKERDFPHLDSTSQLSPYLNLGMISIRQCIQALFHRQHGHFHIEHLGQQTWLDELLWREFYQHILFDFPQVSKHQPFKADTQKIQWRDAPEDLAAWQQGQTGIPIVDAGMRQLLATGWMHNRVRMITAMFLTKNLLIDWRLGEQWFMQHLIDGDLAANNGGWQWCASTGTDSVPYFRIFNPISQSQKFDANGDYIRQWVPELTHLDAKTIHEPYAKNSNLALNYPKPIADLKQTRIRAIEAFKNI